MNLREIIKLRDEVQERLPEYIITLQSADYCKEIHLMGWLEDNSRYVELTTNLLEENDLIPTAEQVAYLFRYGMTGLKGGEL